MRQRNKDHQDRNYLDGWVTVIALICSKQFYNRAGLGGPRNNTIRTLLPANEFLVLVGLLCNDLTIFFMILSPFARYYCPYWRKLLSSISKMEVCRLNLLKTREDFCVFNRAVPVLILRQAQIWSAAKNYRGNVLCYYRQEWSLICLVFHYGWSIKMLSKNWGLLSL